MKKYMGYKLKVLNKTWSVYFLTKSQFEKKYGSVTLGATEIDDREIYFRRDQFTRETTTHELFHAYVQEYGAHTMDLSIEQMEELCCDIMSKDGQDILNQASELTTAYKTLIRRPISV